MLILFRILKMYKNEEFSSSINNEIEYLTQFVTSPTRENENPTTRTICTILNRDAIYFQKNISYVIVCNQSLEPFLRSFSSFIVTHFILYYTLSSLLDVCDPHHISPEEKLKTEEKEKRKKQSLEHTINEKHSMQGQLKFDDTSQLIIATSQSVIGRSLAKFITLRRR